MTRPTGPNVLYSCPNCRRQYASRVSYRQHTVAPVNPDLVILA